MVEPARPAAPAPSYAAPAPSYAAPAPSYAAPAPSYAAPAELSSPAAEAAPVPDGAWETQEQRAEPWQQGEAPQGETWPVGTPAEPVELRTLHSRPDPQGIDALEAEGWPEPRRRRYWPVLTLLLLLASGGLWAAGVVEIPGVPVPPKVRDLFTRLDAGEPTKVEAPVAAGTQAEPEPSAATVSRTPAGDPRETADDADKRERPGRRGREAKTSKAQKSGLRPAATDYEEEDTGERQVEEPAEKPQPTKTLAINPAPPPPPAPPSTAGGDSPALIHYKQGNLFLKEKKVTLAIDEFKACLAADAKYGMAYRSLGVAYMLLGREKSAIEAYEKFVQVEPAHKDTDKVRQIIQDYYRRNPR